MNTITNYILLLLLITSFSSFGQVMEDAMEAAAEEAYGPNDQVPADIFFGNESDPNFVKFITPSGSITIYYPEVLMVDEGDFHSVHFPLFGVAPIIPDHLDMTAKDVFRRGKTGGLLRLSLAFNDQGDYNFLRDDFDVPAFECNQDFYQMGVNSDGLSDMSHTLDQSGSEYVLDFYSTFYDDDSYQLVLHVEAKPSPAIINDETTNKPTNVYYFPDMGLLAYQERPYKFFGADVFIPLPEGNATKSGYFDPESYEVYEFESLSEEDVSFNIYRIKSYEGDRYEQTIHAPEQDANPDISKMILTDDMLLKTIEATTIYTINSPSMILEPGDLDEVLRACIYPHKYDGPEPVIGSSELPESQSLAVDPKNFRSFSLINSRLEGISFKMEGNTITQKKTNIEDLVAKARYQAIKDNAGKQADKLFDFIYYMYENSREMANNPMDWWKSKAKELKVKEIDGDDPRAYAEGIMGYYGVDRDIANYIVYEQHRKKYGAIIELFPELNQAAQDNDSARVVQIIQKIEDQTEFKTDPNLIWYMRVSNLMESIQNKVPRNLLAAIEGNNYSDRFWVDLIINDQGQLVTAAHHRPGSNGDIRVSFTYDQDQMNVEIVDEEERYFERSFTLMEGLIDYNFILAALPAMKLKSGYQNELHLTNYRASTFGGDHSIKPVFNKVSIDVTGEETFDFLNEQVETFKVQLKFRIRPQNPTVSTIYEAMFLPDGSNLYQLNVWISKKDNMPIRLQTNGGSYWLFREGQDIKKWDQWMSNNNPDPFGL